MSKHSRNQIVFFVATFIWTWAFYAPIAISGNSPYQMPWAILLIFGGMGPSVVGVVMALLTYEKEQRREFWFRCFSLKRIRSLWWLVILLIFPAIYGLSIAIDLMTGGAMPGMKQLTSLMANPIMWLPASFLSFMSGPWAEEFGWRGYALEPMLSRFGIIRGSIGLGVIWAVWHLPLFFMPATWHGQIGFKLTGFWMFILSTIGLALIMTWVYQNTNRSILSGMLLHFTSNFTGQLLAPITEHTEILRMVFLLGVGVIACMIVNRTVRSVALYSAKQEQSV